jgi:hypothetical protein
METTKKNARQVDVSKLTEIDLQEIDKHEELAAKLKQISIGIKKLQISKRNDLDNLEKEINKIDELISEAQKLIKKNNIKTT